MEGLSSEAPAYRVELSDEAKKDLVRVTCWYEAESSIVGRSFLQAYQQQIALLKQQPYMYATYISSSRRCALKKFPYHLYYRVYQTKATVYVTAIVHQRQDPEVISKRL